MKGLLSDRQKSPALSSIYACTLFFSVFALNFATNGADAAITKSAIVVAVFGAGLLAVSIFFEKTKTTPTQSSKWFVFVQ